MRALVWLALLPSFALGASVSGQITEVTGVTGIAGMEVRLWGETPKGFVFQTPTGQTTLTDATGNYTFATVPAGSYKLDARMPNGVSGNYGDRWYDVTAPLNDGYSPDAADVLVLADTDALTGINIRLEVFGGFDGRAVNVSNVPQVGFNARAEYIADRRSHHNDLTKAAPRAGEFSMRGLRPGATRLVIHDPNYVLGDVVRTGLTVVANTAPFLSDTSMSAAPGDGREPNNSSTDTNADFDDSIFRTAVPTAFTANAAIGPRSSGDTDWYCFNAVEGDRFLLEANPTLVLEDATVVAGPWFDPVISFHGPSGKLAEDDDTGPGSAAAIDTGELTVAGRYCLAVTAFGDTGFTGVNQASAGTYEARIALGNRRPSVVVTLAGLPTPVPPAVLSIAEGDPITLDSAFFDPDNNLVSGTFELRDANNNVVAGGSVSVSGGTHTFTWTAPNNGARGSPYTFTITVTDGEFTRTASVIIEVTAVNLAPGLPRMIAPDAGSTVDTRTPTLEIAESFDLDEETLTYEFELSWADDGGYTASEVGVDGGWIADAGTAAPSVYLASTPIPENTMVSWRVRAFDGNLANGYSPWTTPWTFFVDSINDAPPAPVLTKPLDQEVLLVRRATLESTNPVDPEGEAVTLTFEVASDITFATPVHTSPATPVTTGSSTTMYTLPMDLDWGGSYFARVTATDSRGGVSPASNVNAFSIRANTSPGAPVLAAPFNSCGASFSVTTAPAFFIVPYVADVELDPIAIELRLFNGADDPATATPLFSADVTQQGMTDTTIPVAGVTFVEDATYKVRVRVSDGINTTTWTECVFIFDAVPPGTGGGGGSATGGGSGTGGGVATGGGTGTGGGSATGGGSGGGLATGGGSGGGEVGGGTGTGEETDGGAGGGGGAVQAKPGCGCTSVDPLAGFALLGVLTLRRRRR